jgi:hypothetical protein
LTYLVLELQLSELVHQLKVIILKPHILLDVHKLNLTFNQCPLGPLSQLPPSLLWRPLDFMHKRKVQPLIKKVANRQLPLNTL